MYPEISVITACHNHGRYIEEMIFSVLVQSFTDFEMIIVNDGSTDNTKEILDKISDEKVRIFHTDNKGPSHARNIAIKSAKAPLILNLDADDKIAPDLLEKGLNILIKNPDAGIVYSDCRYFGARTGWMNTGNFNLRRMLTENQIISAAFFRKKDWEITGGYCERFIYGLEDWDLWLSIIELGRDVIKIPDSLVYYRTYKNITESRSGRRNSDRMMSEFSNALILDRHRELYERFPDVYRKHSKKTTGIEKEIFPVRLLKNINFILKQKIRFFIQDKVTQGYWK